MASVCVRLKEEIAALFRVPISSILEFGEGRGVFPLSVESELSRGEWELGINEERLEKLRELDSREE